MRGHSTYEPKNGFVHWLDARLPIMSFTHESFVAYPDAEEPELLVDLRRHPLLLLVAQIVTGVVLAMHYTPEFDDGLRLASSTSCAT